MNKDFHQAYSNGKSYYPWKLSQACLTVCSALVKSKYTFVCSWYLLVCILDILSLKYTNCLGTRQYFTMWCFDTRFSPIFLAVSPGLALSWHRANVSNLVIIIKILNIMPGLTDSGWAQALPEYRGPGALKLLIGDMFVSDNIFVTSAVFYDAVSFLICEQGRI